MPPCVFSQPLLRLKLSRRSAASGAVRVAAAAGARPVSGRWRRCGPRGAMDASTRGAQQGMAHGGGLTRSCVLVSVAMYHGMSDGTQGRGDVEDHALLLCGLLLGFGLNSFVCIGTKMAVGDAGPAAGAHAWVATLGEGGEVFFWESLTAERCAAVVAEVLCMSGRVCFSRHTLARQAHNLLAHFAWR